jgi:hypothetical protein
MSLLLVGRVFRSLGEEKKGKLIIALLVSGFARAFG